jgi:hypothetical protein
MVNLDVRLEKAANTDAKAIFEIQVNAFMPLPEKYVKRVLNEQTTLTFYKKELEAGND